MTATIALVHGPYLYSEMDTMSGAIIGNISSGDLLSGAYSFALNSPKQFWVCTVKSK